jgi:hypothetical protein
LNKLDLQDEVDTEYKRITIEKTANLVYNKDQLVVEVEKVIMGTYYLCKVATNFV